MQQFTVPQFIDVEAKILGPITARQFVIMLGVFFIGAVSYKIFDFSLFLTVTLSCLVIGAIFAFVRINGRPFHFFVVNFLQTVKRTKLRVWNNASYNVSFEEATDEFEKAKDDVFIPSATRPTTSKLAELSLIVDTGGVYRGEEKGSKVDIKTLNK